MDDCKQEKRKILLTIFLQPSKHKRHYRCRLHAHRKSDLYVQGNTLLLPDVFNNITLKYMDFNLLIFFLFQG